MSKQNPKPPAPRQQPGPGRSTSESAFNEVRREVAQRNERAHQEARKLRAARDRAEILRNRDRDF
jgi:hypothetical protein